MITSLGGSKPFVFTRILEFGPVPLWIKSWEGRTFGMCGIYLTTIQLLILSVPVLKVRRSWDPLNVLSVFTMMSIRKHIVQHVSSPIHQWMSCSNSKIIVRIIHILFFSHDENHPILIFHFNLTESQHKPLSPIEFVDYPNHPLFIAYQMVIVC